MPEGRNSGGDEILHRQKPEPFGEQRVHLDLLAQRKRQLDLLANQLEALEFHLPSTDVEAGEDLVVGRRGGVGHVSVAKGALHRVVILVIHVNHRSLTQRRQRLVGRLGRINTNPDPRRFRQGIPVLRRRVFRGIRLAAITFGQGFCRIHGGSFAVCRRESGERKPGFIPQKDQVRLDRKTSFHDPNGIIHDSVEGAVGQNDEPHPVQFPCRLQFTEATDNFPERHRAIHGKVVQRIGVEIDHPRPGEHHRVMVGFVTVTVDEDDVARPDQALADDLVRARGAVGDEERAARAEGSSRHFLGFLDRSVRVEQTVQTARGCRGFRQENVRPVKPGHVLDPVRLDDRLPARNGHRVKDARRLFRVFSQRLEERGPSPAPHAAHQAQVQLEIVFLLIEDPPEDRAALPGGVFQRDIRDQVNIVGIDQGYVPAPVALGMTARAQSDSPSAPAAGNPLAPPGSAGDRTRRRPETPNTTRWTPEAGAAGGVGRRADAWPA